MKLLMGVDVGTTRVKCLLFDLEGHVLGKGTRNCPVIRSQEGWVEQDPDALWQALVSTAREALAQAGAGSTDVVGMSLSTQGGTSIPVGTDGVPLRTAISWMDRRGRDVASELDRAISPEEGYRLTGWRGSGYSAWAHIAWMRRHEPEIYARTGYFLQVNDYLILRLTGKLCQDPSNSGITRLYDVLADRWADEALDAVGITVDQLSPLAPSAQPVAPLTGDAAAELGLAKGAWVMNGAHDQFAAALGAGVIHPGQVLLSCGTAWVILITTADPAFSTGASAMAISRHAVAGRWGALRSMAGVGTTVEWYVDAVLAPIGGFAEDERSNAFEFMNEYLPNVPLGSNGLFCFPLEGGHISRRRRDGGVFWGLKTCHSKADLGRAVLEGVGYELRWLVEMIETPHTPIRSFVMVGGASQSSCWPQVIADITGRPVTVPALQEAGARGAALMAGMGLGCLTAEDGFSASRGADLGYRPRPDALSAYDGLFDEYRTVFEALAAPG